MMLGGILQFYFMSIHIPLVTSLFLVSLIVGFLGYLIHLIFVKHTKNPTELSLIILTIGLAMIIRGIAMLAFGKNAHSVSQFLPFESVTVFGLTFSSQYLVVLFGAIILAGFLFYLLSMTNFGKVMLAASQNPLACSIFGIDVEMVKSVSFFLSGLLGAVGGSIIAPISFAKYNMGLIMGLKGFSASVVGGFGNNIGAIVGGLIIGISESLTAGYISSSYKDAVAFFIMILVLFVKPSGIYGSKDVERV